ncbi:RNA-binding transcriptional accessory protein [Formosimonas limnophila]|uniref:RNA-binding transcriptional accessory protein n=1 Tax=Formosimonas limnophila TaxID=1384487 RepID=A0A8J3CGK7_9BURK|nr:Tex family protein [Formosimonas limnophila]GHA68589.1 RNA-binding transcriptional accessory protein [Formosimonas limnophila]
MSTTTAADILQNRIIPQIAADLQIKPHQALAAVTLLNEGATVPFISRYRKEVTDGLDDTQLRSLEERLNYLTELEERRAAIVKSIEEQGKLTPELFQSIDTAATKQTLEDLYLPYKPKRRTRAQIAREAGLEPLALALLADPTLDSATEAAKYLNAEAGINDVKAALNGARDILAENFSENAELLANLRAYLNKNGVVYAAVVAGKETEGQKFLDYFAYDEKLANVPSHRALAIFRGRNEGILTVRLGLSEELEQVTPHPCETQIAQQFNIADQNCSGDAFLLNCCRWAWRVKLQLHLETELLGNLREAAELEAINVFGKNLRDLLLAAPAGHKAIMGIDPGIRTGCKIAVIDSTSKFLAHDTIYPHQPRNDWEGSLHRIAVLAKQHGVQLIAIGNGTASRETEKLVADLMKRHPELGLQKIVVSEAGASVYSASELAAKEFPDLDVSIRGAVSIARRLQDPLAELVKIDAKAIGVGQYQHDVNQRELARALTAVVEDCVNAVGVDVNTASAQLLANVSGLNSILAKNIVDYRDANGAFENRNALKKVPRLGDKTFEQAAGFLRIANSTNPLDASAVHPEAYPVVEKILAKIQQGIKDVMGKKEALKGVSPSEFTDEKFGLPTVKDIFNELEKPGRDPRGEFKTATFSDGIEDIRDLTTGMILEGVITNVANFGAFVDIGVHQDGLVHISALSNKYVSDPREVVKTGQLVKVKVMEVDVQRARIGLSMRLDDEPSAGSKGGSAARNPERRTERNHDRGNTRQAPQTETAFAAAFAKLKR